MNRKYNVWYYNLKTDELNYMVEEAESYSVARDNLKSKEEYNHIVFFTEDHCIKNDVDIYA